MTPFRKEAAENHTPVMDISYEEIKMYRDM